MEALFKVDPIETKGKNCKDCENRQRWQCNSKVIQYCGVRKSNRTNNGLLKIKTTDKACELFTPNTEQK